MEGGSNRQGLGKALSLLRDAPTQAEVVCVCVARGTCWSEKHRGSLSQSSLYLHNVLSTVAEVTQTPSVLGPSTSSSSHPGVHHTPPERL